MLRPRRHHHNQTFTCQAQNTADRAYRAITIKLQVSDILYRILDLLKNQMFSFIRSLRIVSIISLLSFYCLNSALILCMTRIIHSCNIFIHPPKNSKQKEELDVEFETVVIYNKMLPIVCSNFLLIQRHLKNC